MQSADDAVREGTLVVARGLTKVYRMGRAVSVTALDDVDLDIERGILMAVVGPSGSGKSTLLNVIGCLDTPDRGELIVDGLRADGKPRAALAGFRLRTIGFVFQRFNLLEHLTALENVALPLHYCRPRPSGVERTRRAEEALRSVGLGHRLHHRPDQLAGGEQQRVGIARAIVNRPRLVLADEPTGELDTTTGRQVIDLLHRLVQRGTCSVVIVTHDAEVTELADRVVRMVDGRVLRE